MSVQFCKVLVQIWMPLPQSVRTRLKKPSASTPVWCPKSVPFSAHPRKRKPSKGPWSRFVLKRISGAGSTAHRAGFPAFDKFREGFFGYQYLYFPLSGRSASGIFASGQLRIYPLSSCRCFIRALCRSPHSPFPKGTEKVGKGVFLRRKNYYPPKKGLCGHWRDSLQIG